MSRCFVLTAVAAALTPATAYGQGWAGESRVTTVLDLSGSSASSAAGAELLVDANVLASWEDVLQNGTKVRLEVAARYQHDGGASDFGFDCPLPACGPAGGGQDGLTGSPFSASSSDNSEAWAGFETASLTLTGPWGETAVGRQAGVAVRLDARAPSVLETAGAYSSQLAPSGSQIVRARNEPTGQAFKLSYLSPRILGVRVGASFTPAGGFKSADFDPDDRFEWSPGAPLDRVWEGAISFSRSFPDTGLKLRAGVTATEGRYVSGLDPDRAYRSQGYGVEIERGPSTVGLRALSSETTGSKAYSAIEFGAVHDFGLWKIGFETGRSKQKVSGLEGWTSLLAVRRQVSDAFDVGLGFLSTKTTFARAVRPDQSDDRSSRRGLLVELTVRK